MPKMSMIFICLVFLLLHLFFHAFRFLFLVLQLQLHVHTAVRECTDFSRPLLLEMMLLWVFIDEHQRLLIVIYPICHILIPIAIEFVGLNEYCRFNSFLNSFFFQLIFLIIIQFPVTQVSLMDVDIWKNRFTWFWN